MRTLRRSCDACAKAKHACDLRTPQCSRCVKRKARCVYANQPLTSAASSSLSDPTGSGSSSSRSDDDASSISTRDGSLTPSLSEASTELVKPVDLSFDPFDSYPSTRLPRAHVQRLIHHFLSSIAFQYYPLDLSMNSNPFVVSWWPLALSDPALFHVSLQTASLDEELRAQKGFPISELLMMDSVSLVRQKIGDSSLAVQNETMNSVVTLAAIEYGKGNITASTMHIDGVKRMVDLRGGLNAVKATSPLTARMVAWVSMVVKEAPQFLTQDDFGFGDGVGPILQWQMANLNLEEDATAAPQELLPLEPEMKSILTRLRCIFHSPQLPPLTSTELHDLTCFVVHKLLLLPPPTSNTSNDPTHAAVNECLRNGMVLYMLVIHGTTYYSHANIAHSVIAQMRSYMDALNRNDAAQSALHLWLLSVAMVSAVDPVQSQWCENQSIATATTLGLQTWDDVLVFLQNVLWVSMPQGDVIRHKWEKILELIKAK